MSKLQIPILLLLWYLIYTSAEETEAQKRIDSFLKPPPVLIKHVKAPPEEPSYFSKLTNWFRSLGGNNEKPTVVHSAIQGPGPSLPPIRNPIVHHGSPSVKHGPVTFKNQDNALDVDSTHNSNQYLPPHPQPYLPFSNDKDCNPCNREPWIPIVGHYGSNTLIGFVPHSGVSHQSKPNGVYGPPNNLNSHQQYGPPSTGPQILPQTPNNNYGPPSDIIQFGPPLQHRPSSHIPNNHHSFKQRPNLPPFPDTFMGPPPVVNFKYGPPSTDFGRIQPSSFGNFGASNNYGSPDHNNLRSPNSDLLPVPNPTNNYGPPELHPNNNFGFSSSGIENFDSASHVSTNLYNAPSSNVPVVQNSNQYFPPSTTSDLIHPTLNYQDSSHSTSAKFNQHSGNHQQSLQVTNEEYLPPPHQLPISNGNDNYDDVIAPPHGVPDPIPFPNMSPSFVLPIKNSRPFKNNEHITHVVDNLPLPNEKVNSGSNVQISQSIPVAHFLSTIEYPPNIEQSPLIDVVVKNDQPHQENDEKYSVNLKDNPIVVDPEEHHQEASDNHASVATHDEVSPNTLIDDKLRVQLKNSSAKNVNSELDENLAAVIAKHLLSDSSAKPFKVPESNTGKLSPQLNQNAQATNNALFTQPTLDYGDWNPTVGEISMGMIPPAPSESSWLNTKNYIPNTTKKPKQIQIIVPYTTNNKRGNWFPKDLRQVPSNIPPSLLSKLPSGIDSEWTKYLEESRKKPSETPSLVNIQDFFKDATVNVDHSHSQGLPFDILKFQKNIDVWTEQEFNKMKSDEIKASTTTRFAYSKKIPEEYLTTQSIIQSTNDATTPSPNNRNSKLILDYLASGSVHHSFGTSIQNLTEVTNIDGNSLETNLIDSEGTTTQKSDTETSTPPTWEKIQVSISPVTNERVYVVTPQPWEIDTLTPQSAWSYVPKNQIHEINKHLAGNTNFVFNSPRFSIRPQPLQMNKSKDEVNSRIHSAYSHWPELINNLATTNTSAATSHKTATAHPLLGRMDLSGHTPAPAVPNSPRTVQTFTGHSKVVTAVTASTVAKKRQEDKKFSTETAPESS